MHYVTDLIDEGNLCGLVIVVLILVAVGQKMVQSKPNLQLWGLRIAALTFIAFTVTQIVEGGVPGTSELLSALLVGLAGGALVLGPCWIVLAISGFVVEHYRNVASAARCRTESRQRERDQRREVEERREQEKMQPLSPEQEEAEQEAALERQRQLEEQKALSKRREEAIAACEVLFHLRAPDIANRFSREQFDEFVKKYMGERKPIEVIEDRAGDLQQLIQQHYESVHPPMRFTDLSALTAWYERQREQIRSLSIDDVYKEDFLVRLNERYAELTQETLENLS